MKKKPSINPDQALKEVKKIFKERGSKALETARREVLKERIECKEAKAALKYFITKYWHDVTRPSLLSLSCEAVGGPPEATTSMAVSLILTSGAADIHDDIIDQSKKKGFRDTVVGRFGKNIALLVGDALLFKGLALLHQAIENGISAEKKNTIIDLLKKGFFELGDAEALELSFHTRKNVTPKEYLRVLKKKAADMEAYLRIGAILGGGTQEEIEALGQYGRILGILILLRDDIIDLIDIQETLQRIRKEILPLPVLYALQNTKEKAQLTSLLNQRITSRSKAQKIVELTRKAGGIERTQRMMQKLIEEACDSIDNIPYDKKKLELLAHAMISFAA